MAAIEVGRVCIKTRGRDAGREVVVAEIVDRNFVIVAGDTVKRRRCNIAHLEPTPRKAEVPAGKAPREPKAPAAKATAGTKVPAGTAKKETKK